MMSSRLLFPATVALRSFDRQVDRLLEQALAAPTASWSPALDIAESEAGYTLVLDVPGVSAESLSIGLERGVLTLKGERAPVARDETLRWHRGERAQGGFVRQVTLPSHVDASRITASLEHGVLTITVPKAESAKARQIPVTVPQAIAADASAS
ncbi:MAG: Hsp20/alpha crystallin family protein [Gemmatimonadaceae bacterium]|jgi:HSP20 family protein|nr:Hsp20/alpha crystallin family protein [Gemmatimonadaceae bacterium]